MRLLRNTEGPHFQSLPPHIKPTNRKNEINKRQNTQHIFVAPKINEGITEINDQPIKPRLQHFPSRQKRCNNTKNREERIFKPKSGRLPIKSQRNRYECADKPNFEVHTEGYPRNI